MDALTVAADELGVTVPAMRAALDRGETIGSLAAACGLDVTALTAAAVDAEVADVEALASIAGFSQDDITLFAAEMADSVRSFVHHGDQLSAASIVPPPLAPAS